ncbi:hypothetical protein N7510_011573 [Penicillium lagena]|uniref:uncharacterized protein n=1 Tax=Penicillium lagena TaxID=94218 RepID=UPI0025403803|nr:uncharacterized protein N7510_011573 [Penicillium lagena]KAJ5602039.1 hypothetical protein N7510_011573 [Penicillium lagena]
MSGLEVVGVVLGALPLIITAVDQYRASKRLFKVFRHKEPYIDRLIQTLRAQKFLLETDLSMTLKETFGDPDFVQSTSNFAQTTSLLFENQEVARRVQENLGDGYEHYIVALSQCEQALAEIAGHISGLASGEQDLSALVQAYPQRNGSYEFTRKIKFALDRGELERRIKDLNDATMMLSRIRDYSLSRTRATIPSRSSAVTRTTTSFKSIREHACRLYSAISATYRGSCHPQHGAHLFLQSRADLLDGKHRRLKKTPVAFTISFDPVGRADIHCSSSITEVMVLEEDTLTSYSNNSAIYSGPSTSHEPSIEASHVSYQLPTRTETNSSSTITTFPSTSRHPSSTLSIIRDLCLHLSRMTELRGLQLSRDCHLWYHQSTRTIISSEPCTATSVVYSLDQVLQPSSTMKLLLNSRIALSFNIASSVMQLNLTQWIHTPLTSNMIRLLPESPDRRGPAIRPFISHRFSSSFEVMCASNFRRIMLELGIILLELWHAKTFAVYAAEVEKPLDDSFGVRYDVARLWLDTSRDDVLPFYLDVVTRCVECIFATATANLDWNDTTLRESFYGYVVKPLWDNCPAELR